MEEFDATEYDFLLRLFRKLREVDGITIGQMMGAFNVEILGSNVDPILGKSQMDAVLERLAELDEEQD